MSADPWQQSTHGGGALDWATNLGWQDSGLCREIGPALFHSQRVGETESINAAKQVCNGSPDRGVEPCPVRDACLAWAFAIGDGWAVLGGTSPRQRQRMQAEERRLTGGRVRCRVCRRLYTASPNQQDCGDECRAVSRRRRNSHRKAS